MIFSLICFLSSLSSICIVRLIGFFTEKKKSRKGKKILFARLLPVSVSVGNILLLRLDIRKDVWKGLD